MASPTLPAESVFSYSTPYITDSPLDTTASISASQPLPAANPSHSRVSSKEGISPRTQPPPSQLPQNKTPTFRNKSKSFSFPVLINNAASIQAPPADRRRPSARPKNALRIHVPHSSDTSFLTTLAAQERKVLEIKEELSKAEESLSRLKSQWASHESRKRESESRKLHRMKSIRSDVPPTPKFPSFAGGLTTPREMFEEMQKRKASMDQPHKPSPRQRRFSGSRQMRDLSLVSPDAILKFADSAHARQESTPPTRPSTEKQEKVISPNLLNSPDYVPPTPELVHEGEDEDATDGATDSQRSSESPKRSRHNVRSSLQMAADFREGLWTFFEDLKQATYGEDARGPEARPRGGSKPEIQLRRDPQARDASHPHSKQKRTIRRQTWQIRPRESDESLANDVHSHPPRSQSRQETVRPERPALGARTSTAPVETPKKARFYEKEVDGELWQTWDTPRTESRSTTPVPSTRNPSLDTQARKLVAEDGRRGSLPWPALSKLKPGQLTRTASQLMDEWEHSLHPPSTYQQVQQVQQQHDEGRRSPRPASPRPVSKRSNSRMDDVYT